MRNKLLKLASMLSVVALLAMPQMASAANNAGTQVTNTATLTYSVGGVTQPTVSNTPGGAESFVIDQAVDLTVATTDGAPVSVVPGQTANVLTFTVTNLGNGVQDVLLDPYAVVNGQPAKFNGATDNADMAPVAVFVETDGTPGYSAGDTTTFIDELAPGANATVYIVANAPTTLVNGDIASYHLVATAAVGGTAGTQGAVQTETPAASRTIGAKDFVFADAAGSATTTSTGGSINDVAYDGKHSSQDDYQVVTATISVSKSVAVVASPIPGGSDPIPGATVEYTITIVNSGGASAILSTMGDPIDTNLTLNGTGSWALSSGGGAALTADLGDGDGDGLGYTAGPPDNLTYTITTFLITANTTVARAVPGELQAGETLTLKFQATIN